MRQYRVIQAPHGRFSHVVHLASGTTLCRVNARYGSMNRQEPEMASCFSCHRAGGNDQVAWDRLENGELPGQPSVLFGGRVSIEEMIRRSGDPVEVARQIDMDHRRNYAQAADGSSGIED